MSGKWLSEALVYSERSDCLELTFLIQINTQYFASIPYCIFHQQYSYWAIIPLYYQKPGFCVILGLLAISWMGIGNTL